MGPLWGEIPISRAFFYTLLRALGGGDGKSPDITKSHLSLEVPGQGALLPCSPIGASTERDAPSPEPMIYTFSESPVKELCHEMGGKPIVTVHGAPHRQKAYYTMGCGLVPQGDRLQCCYYYPVQCSLQHDTYHLGLGRPEPC